MTAQRTKAQDHSNVTNIYKPATSPGPAPSPTALSQLKNTMGTMMNVSPSKAGTKEDPNTYNGTYGGKNWTWSQGKSTRSK